MDDEDYEEWLDGYKEHGLTWEEWKNRSANGVLKQYKKGDKVFITEQALNKMKVIDPNGYSDEAISNAFLRRKELLSYAKESNESNEVVGVININNGKFSDFVKGNKNSVDFLLSPEIYHMIMSNEKQSLELIHNHPGLSYFSLNDINVFMMYNSIKTISIVTNQGKTWYINKLDSFDFSKARETMKELLDKYSDFDEIVEKFLKKGYTFGVERN